MPKFFFREKHVWRAALLLLGSACLAWAQGNTFVQRTGGTLTLSGSPFRFGGTNSYPLMYSNQGTVDQILQTAANSNLKVVRMWVFCDSTCGNDYFFQSWNPAAGAPAYNDTVRGLDNVDLAVNEANTLGIKLIMTLTNNWTDFGGMDEYVKWRNLQPQTHDQFYTDATILQWYENWVNHVLNHVNTVQGPSYGVAYKNDPTIMAWELANEPECGGSGTGSGGYPTSGSCTNKTIIDWIDTASTYIKSIDSNHLVAVGDEGFFCGSSSCAPTGNGVDSQGFSAVGNIDLVGFHLYPDTWGESIAWSEDFINQHLQEAQQLGKPLYMGEFGLLSANAKEFVYSDWTNLIFSSLGSGTEVGAGAMFWDVLPGVPAPANADPENGFDEEAGSPVLSLMSDFAQIMAGPAGELPPVAGNRWAATPFGVPATVTLDVLSNDVAYNGATIDPTSINLGPNPQVPQTSLAVTGGVFNVVGQTIQFTPQAGFSGTPFGSYTVKDSNSQPSNVGYLFVTVNPAETCCAILESFESGTDGWGPGPSPAAGTSATSPTNNTEGKYSLQVNVTVPGWFGVTFPTPVDLSSWPSIALDITPTTVGGYTAFAFQAGSSYEWCQSSSFQPLSLFSTTTVTLNLKPSALTCYSNNGVVQTAPDLTAVHSILVSLPSPTTYYLDNLRAAPAAGVSPPLPAISGVANSEGGQPGASAGTYVSIYGSNFAVNGSAAAIWSDYVVNSQLPTSLAGVSVSMGGKAAYVYYVSPTQINVLAPNLGTGNLSVTVTTPAGTSAPFSITSSAVQPAFLVLWPTTYVLATDTNYNILAKNGTVSGLTTTATKPGETIILWGTGFGPTTPPAPLGQAVPSDQAYRVAGVTVTIGGTPANVIATALSPGNAGLYQVAITVPLGLAGGDYSVIATTADGTHSPAINLTVQP